MIDAVVLALTVLVLTVMTASALSLGRPDLRLWAGFTLGEIVSGEARHALQQRPAFIVLVGTSEYLGYLAVLATLGVLDPLRLASRPFAGASWFTQNDPFVDAVSATRRALGASRIHVRVYLSSGRTYIGLLQSVSSKSGASGNRDLFLGSPAEVRGDEMVAIGRQPEYGGILVNTRDIEAIELSYETDDYE